MIKYYKYNNIIIEFDDTNIKYQCVICQKRLLNSDRHYIQYGNYCIRCTQQLAINADSSFITEEELNEFMR